MPSAKKARQRTGVDGARQPKVDDTDSPIGAHQPIRRLEIAVNEFEQHDGGKFAWSDAYGYLTSCPTNLGTAMRASVHLPLPNLVTHNSENEVLEIAKSLGLTLRGVHGEHSSFGTNGLVDVSPSTRLWVSEGEIVTRLYRGIDKLMKQEQDYQ